MSISGPQPDGFIPSGSPFSLSAVGTVFDVPTAGYGGISYTLSGTFSATLMVEATNDPTGATGWYSVGAVRTDIRGGSGTTGGSVALGNYVFANNGARLRLRVATYTSGTVTAAVVMLKDRPGLDVVYLGGGVTVAQPTAAIGTNRSITATTTAANAMAANTARKLWKVKNDSTVDVWINFFATATAAAGGGNIKIAAGGYFASEPMAVETGAMSMIAASGTAAVTVVEV